MSWMQTDTHLNCKDHIEEMIPKLSTACYAVRYTVRISNISTLKSVYFCIFSFWIVLGNCSNSGKIFTLQNQIGRIMACAHPWTSCTNLFQQLGILPVCTFINEFISTHPKVHLYTILIQRISTILTDWILTYLVFIDVHSVMTSKL